MAAPELDTPEARGAAVALLDPDFHGLLQVKELTETVQARLALAHIKSVSRMSAVADDRAGIRQFCERALQLRAVEDMVDVASVVDAWESCQTRMSIKHKAEAEASVTDVPRAVNKVEVHDLIAKYEGVHGYKLEDKTTPASATLELVFDQVEQGEMKNMSLVQFVSREDSEGEIFGVNVEKGTGTLTLKKGYGECPKPKTPEELRQRMQVLAHTYLLAQLKYPQRTQLKDLQIQHFLRYLDFLLGDHVWGLKAKNKDGEVVSSPDFGLVLAYDYQMRRSVTKQVNEGVAMAAALKIAMGDTVIKERYFITPNVFNQVGVVAEGHRSRSPRDYRDGAVDAWRPWGTKGDKGKGKGKSGKKGKKGKALHDRTPDGRQICWKWNSQHERCRYKCGRVHVCQACLGDHPLHACPGGGKDTKGKAEEAAK